MRLAQEILMIILRIVMMVMMPPPPFTEHSISQDKPGYAAVATKPSISVAKLYCLLMLPFLAG